MLAFCRRLGGAASVKTCVFYISQLWTAQPGRGGGNVASRLGGLRSMPTPAGRALELHLPLSLFPSALPASLSPAQASVGSVTASGARAPRLTQAPDRLGPLPVAVTALTLPRHGHAGVSWPPATCVGLNAGLFPEQKYLGNCESGVLVTSIWLDTQENELNCSNRKERLRTT